MKTKLWLLGIAAMLLNSCTSDYTPKPRGYFRIDYPKHVYAQFTSEGCPFTFEYPTYAKVVRDTAYFNTRPDNPYWFNVVMPQFQGNINLTYKPISPKQTLAKLMEDAHKLAYEHTAKADYIDEDIIHNKEHNVYGVYYDIGGNAASSIQFFVTDSTKHFVRGALYFATEPNADSLAPVIRFVKQDIAHMISTWRWTK